jgi:glutamate 5-kinase
MSKRIVLKLGTQVVMDDTGHLNRPLLKQHVTAMAGWLSQGDQLLVVTSGAVGLGRNVLGLTPPLPLVQKQACAAVGQSLLMNTWRELFDWFERPVAQVLLTAADLADRQRYLNLRDTLETLLGLGVVPILNENDVVSTAELAGQSFGDNDKLSALVASKLDADRLILLTNVDGIYTHNPNLEPDKARRIAEVDTLDVLNTIDTQGQSAYGRGGMSSKVAAARIAWVSGVETWVTSGLLPDALTQTTGGTWIRPGGPAALSGKKRWIGFASGYQGVIVVNDGAAQALTQRGASLLAVGIRRVDGPFQARQVVSVHNEQGHEIGRGVSRYGADELCALTPEQARLLEEVIHRDNLVMFTEDATHDD